MKKSEKKIKLIVENPPTKEQVTVNLKKLSEFLSKTHRSNPHKHTL